MLVFAEHAIRVKDAREASGSSRFIAQGSVCHPVWLRTGVCPTRTAAFTKGQLDDYRRVGPDKRAIYLETDPYGMPSLREHVQKHTACRFDSPLWQAPSWTEVANGYLDLTQWGPPPWSEIQWVTLRNVIELAEEG